jgi:DNA-binding LacI/PurR family transcriptional regulator
VVVVLQEQSPDPSIQSVSVDLEAGGYMATRHLIDLGHHRIAHVTERLHEPGTRRDRLDGYRRALEEAGLAFDPSLVLTAENTMAGGSKAIEQLLAFGTQRPTAGFMYNDLMAVGALHALRAHRLSVPDDFAVVGFDGVAIGQFTVPTLTTIDHPREELGRLAIEALIGALEKRPADAREHLLPVQLVVRESCGGGKASPPMARCRGRAR